MIPLFNSLTYRPNQIPTDGTTTASTSQQAIPSNHFQGNPAYLFPDSALTQPVMNPQTATPFNSSSTYVRNNRHVAMLNRPISAPMGAPNHSLPLQTGMPLLGSTTLMSHLGQFHGGSCPQMPNAISINPMNLIQSPNHIFAHNSENPPQYSCQNSVFLNGQLCFQNPMQETNHFVQTSPSNFTQVGPCTMQLYSNQVSHGFSLPNPAFFPIQPFGILHSNAVLQPNQNQHRLDQSTMDANATAQSDSTQHSQRNSPLPPAFASVLPQHTRKDFHPSGSTKPQLLQGNLIKDDGNNWNNNWKDSHSRKSTRDLRSDESHRGFLKPQFHNVQNAKGKVSSHNKYWRKGKLANSTNKTQVVQRRSLSLNYTEQEIKQWREERRQNYPSKCNIKKKLTERHTEPEAIIKHAKLRHQQLKEILAKQAELGCEVAEIPSCYLSDTEKQVRGKEVGNNALTTKNFQNKYNKRGRYLQKERFSKQEQSAYHYSSNLPNSDERFSQKKKLRHNDSRTKPSLNEKQPTLLQRLLSADIRREKHSLLQVFKFMLMNSFFKDWPDKSPKFPLVIVKDNASEGEVVEEKFPKFRKRGF